MDKINKIKIIDIIIEKHTIMYKLDISGEWKKYFTNNLFYSKYDIDISKIPKEIAVIPILGTLIPLAFIFYGIIEVDKIDYDFYHCIDNLRRGYASIFSDKMTFGGEIEAQNIIKNESFRKKTCVLFSGGVDAYNTLITNAEKYPHLITIWGSDVEESNQTGFAPVKNHLEETAKLFGCKPFVIKSSFRKMLIDSLIDKDIVKSGDTWWHGFHHGVGLLALIAPFAYVNEIKTVYIASSFTIKDRGIVSCASDPRTDNNVSFCGTNVIHDGFEYTRQQKVNKITEYHKKNGIPIRLRVCWHSKNGDNCCNCEKCFRTMTALIAERQVPLDYGFTEYPSIYPKLARDFKNKPYNFLNFITLPYFVEVQKTLRLNYTLSELNQKGYSLLNWFYSVDLSKISQFPPLYVRIYKKMRSIFYKIIKGR